LVCYSEDNAISGPVKATFTAKCVNGVADIDIYARDECFLPVLGLSVEGYQPPQRTSEAVQKPTSSSCPAPEHKSTEGVTKFPKMPIEIVTYGDSKVTFKVSSIMFMPVKPEHSTPLYSFLTITLPFFKPQRSIKCGRIPLSATLLL